MRGFGGKPGLFLPLLLGSTAAAKLVLAWRYPGFLSGDDFEVLATAAKWAAGLDYSPWTIRSLFHPLVLVFPLMRLGVLAGLAAPRWLTFLACVPTIIFSTAAIFLLHSLARGLGLSERASRAVAFLYAVSWPSFAYGSTAYPRPISTAFVLGALLALARSPGGRGPELFAGLLVAAAFAVRWSEAVFLLPLLAFCLVRRKPRLEGLALLLAGFAAGVALFVGVFDALTWGWPFASLEAFFHFLRNLPPWFEPRPWWWYGGMILQWAGPVLVVLAIASFRDSPARVALGIAASSVALLSITGMKSFAYVQTAVPFLAFAAGAGWERLAGVGRAARVFAAACLFLALPLGAERTLHLLGRKSQSSIAAARFLAKENPSPRIIVLEQSWAYGEKLYLGNEVVIRDLTPSRPLSVEKALAAVHGADAVAIYAKDSSDALREALREAGFRRSGEFREGASPAVEVYLADRISRRAGRP